MCDGDGELEANLETRLDSRTTVLLRLDTPGEGGEELINVEKKNESRVPKTTTDQERGQLFRNFFRTISSKVSIQKKETLNTAYNIYV